MSIRSLLLIMQDGIFLSLICLSIFLLFKNQRKLDSHKSVTKLIVAWILFFCFEYYFLGPFSHLHFYDEADTSLVRYLYHYRHYLGGKFLHHGMGGMDYMSQHLIGGQYISLERGLFNLLPAFFAILAHKLTVVGVSLVGAYLLFSKVANMRGLYAFLFACLYSVYNPYSVYSSIIHGIGYAAIPLSIYIFLVQQKDKYYFLKVLILSFILATSSVPTHSLMTLFLALIFWFIIHFKQLNLFKTIASISILFILTLLNWGHAIYAMKEYGQFSARVLTTSPKINYFEIFTGSISYLNGKTELNFLGFTFSYLLLLSSIIVIASLIFKKTRYSKWLIFLLFTVFSPSLIYLITFNLKSLNFLNAVNFYRTSYLLPIPIIFMAWNFSVKFNFKNLLTIPALFFAIALATQLERKSSALRETLLTNQNGILNISNLKNKEWLASEEYFRVVTASLPYKDGFHPNFAWIYGLETLDGYSNLVPKNQIQFWYYGVHKNISQENESFTGGNLYVSYEEENPYSTKYTGNQEVKLISDRIDLNLLRLFNVGYVLSTIALNEDFPLVSIPKGSSPKSQLGTKEKILSRIFNLAKDPSLYIYSLGNYSPRIYFPTLIKAFPPELSISERYRYISKNYCSSCAFTKTKVPSLKPGEIIHWDMVKNGYSGEISAAQPNSLIVFNQFYHPYWKAFADGHKLPILRVNEVQMGVLAPKEKFKLELLYQPPF